MVFNFQIWIATLYWLRDELIDRYFFHVLVVGHISVFGIGYVKIYEKPKTCKNFKKLFSSNDVHCAVSEQKQYWRRHIRRIFIKNIIVSAKETNRTFTAAVPRTVIYCSRFIMTASNDTRTVTVMSTQLRIERKKNDLDVAVALQLSMLHSIQIHSYGVTHVPALSMTLCSQWPSGFKTKAVARTDSNCNLIHNWNLASWTPIIPQKNCPFLIKMTPNKLNCRRETARCLL